MSYKLIQPEPSDMPAIADLINAHSLAVVGTRRALIDEDGDLRTAWARPAPSTKSFIAVLPTTWK